MFLEEIIELKNKNELEKAFNIGIRGLGAMKIDVANNNTIKNAIRIDSTNIGLFTFVQNNAKRDLNEEEEIIVKIILEMIPLAIIFDEIVLSKLFIELINLAKRLGKSKITPLAYLSCAYIKLYYYNDLSAVVDILRKTQKSISKDYKDINILAVYMMCAYFSHLIDDNISPENILRNNLDKCEDPVLCDLIKIYMAQNIILEGGRISDIIDIDINIRNNKERNLLLLYSVYAKAMIGDLSILSDEFLTSLATADRENSFVALILTYMFYVYMNNNKYCKKYSKLILKNMVYDKVYPISYQYYIYDMYNKFRNLNLGLNFKLYFEANKILRNLEFFSILKENEIKNVYTFISGIKDISIGKKNNGEKKLRKSIKEILKFSNMKDYAVFSHMYIIYKRSTEDQRPVKYYIAEMEKAYNYCETKLAWKSFLLEEESGESSFVMKNKVDKDMIAELMDLMEEDYRLDSNIRKTVEKNYNFDRVIVFNMVDQQILDSYEININDIDDVARNLVDYSFKKKKKFFIGGKRGARLRSIDSYLVRNVKSNVMVLPFEKLDKLLYVESKHKINQSIEMELNDFVKNVNKISEFYK